MSQVKEAVIELSSALHEWREKQRPEQMRRVMLAANILEGFALDLEQALTRVAETSPTEKCECGGLLVPYHVQRLNVPLTACSSCNGVFATVRLDTRREA